MEKKSSNRIGYPSAKGIVDTKKVQDVSHKPWPRSGGRRREPPSGFPKPETNRKPIQQRNKMFDKRPKPRGFNCSDVQDCGKEETELEPIGAELGSVFIQGAKKQSLNHLLNFHYVPRDGGSSYGPGRNDRGHHHRWFGTQKHKYNKEQFLQANCQFVVNSDGDYNLYMKNPDLLVNWDSIEQIRVQGSEFPTCPICLYEPTAAKMTRCGHVYCWSCILHYLALSDKAWRKCPICFEAVHKNDLKSVVAKPYSAFNVGDTITMRLMRRERGSLVAVPIEQADINSLLHISETDANTIYSKLLLANFSEIISIIDKERSQLTVQLSEDENCPEKCFIEQAMAQLQIRENTVSGKIKLDVPQKTKLDKYIKDFAIVNENQKISQNIDQEKYFECGKNDIKESEDISPSKINTPSKYFYFYQAVDGQHIYLHSLNVHMLEHVYGSLEFCPSTISGQIIEKEGGSMTEDLRKKFRYIQHLPVTCQFEVAEIQLKPPLVTKETIKVFQDQIETRRKRRQQRAKEERRREKRIAEEENRMMGRFSTPHIRIESHHHFPQFMGSPEDDRSISESFQGAYSEANSTPPNSELSVSPEQSQCIKKDATVSFAKMVTTSKPQTSTWPVLNSKPVRETSTPILIPVTGSSMKTRTRTTFTISDDEPDPEGYIPAPTYNKSFSDAIALAMEQSFNSPPNETTSGKKKKKQKKILFSTTSMVFTGK